MREVNRHEEDNLMRNSQELCNSFEIENIFDDPKKTADNIRKKKKLNHLKSCNLKPQHGLVERK